MRQSAVSRRLLLRTAALSPLALATSKALASEATQSTVAAAPAAMTDCKAKELTEAIAMLWQKFFVGAGAKRVNPEVFVEAVIKYYDTLCANMVCWSDPAKQARALDCALKAGEEAARLAGTAPEISRDNFSQAGDTIKGKYQDTCERAQGRPSPGIVCG
jgi:hypothetical protein